jgi:hypothetical protein
MKSIKFRSNLESQLFAMGNLQKQMKDLRQKHFICSRQEKNRQKGQKEFMLPYNKLMAIENAKNTCSKQPKVGNGNTKRNDETYGNTSNVKPNLNKVSVRNKLTAVKLFASLLKAPKIPPTITLDNLDKIPLHTNYDNMDVNSSHPLKNVTNAQQISSKTLQHIDVKVKDKDDKDKESHSNPSTHRTPRSYHHHRQSVNIKSARGSKLNSLQKSQGNHQSKSTEPVEEVPQIPTVRCEY